MKNTSNFLVMLAIFGLSMSSIAAQDIYIGGKNNNRATIWKNGTPQYLSSGYGEIKSVVVVGEDVYASGIEHASGFFAGKLWKNGVVQYVLNDGKDESSANSIAVFEGDVYVAGGQGILGQFVGRVWKNGVVEEGYTEAGGFFSMFIDSSGIYAAGSIKSNYNNSGVWKNGELLYSFTSGKVNSIRSVVVDNGDVYTAGYEFDGENYVSKVWKNGETFYTFGASGTTFPSAITLFISKGIIYAAGFEINENGKALAKLWTNGTGTDLTDGTENIYATSVFVSDRDVYVAGNENSQKIIYWKNDNSNTLISGNCYANCIFVTDNSANIVTVENFKSVRLYPNPSVGQLLIDSGGLKILKIRIFDLLGKELATFQTNEIDISHLSRGIYFAKIKTEFGELTKKIIKE